MEAWAEAALGTEQGELRLQRWEKAMVEGLGVIAGQARQV